MRAQSAEMEHRTRRRLPWGIISLTTLLTLATIALIWLAAVPFGSGVCPAVYPIPTNCLASHRAGSALIATVAVGMVWAVAILLALLRRRWTRPLVGVGAALLAVSPFISYAAVSWSPGFVLGAAASDVATEDPVGTWGRVGEGSAYLTIYGDGTVRGNDGCNGLGGSWSMADGVVQFSDMVMSLIMCAPRESDPSDIHGPIVTAIVKGDRLHVLDDEGNVSGVLPRRE